MSKNWFAPPLTSSYAYCLFFFFFYYPLDIVWLWWTSEPRSVGFVHRNILVFNQQELNSQLYFNRIPSSQQFVHARVHAQWRYSRLTESLGHRHFETGNAMQIKMMVAQELLESIVVSNDTFPSTVSTAGPMSKDDVFPKWPAPKSTPGGSIGGIWDEPTSKATVFI